MSARNPLRLPADFWHKPETAAAFTRSDVAGLVRLIQARTGATQARVAAAIGISTADLDSLIRRPPGARLPQDLMRGIAAGFCMPDQVQAAFHLHQPPTPRPAPPVRPGPMTSPEPIDAALPLAAAIVQLRVQHGLSQRRLAAKIHINPGYLSKIENGSRRPGHEVVRALDDALDANGALLAKYAPSPQHQPRHAVEIDTSPLRSGPSPEPVDLLSHVATLAADSTSGYLARDGHYRRLVEDLVQWARRTRRRDVLQWLSWAAAAAAAAPILQGLDDDERERTAVALASPRRVDATVLDHIDAVLWRCLRQDDTLGPQAALDTVLAQRGLVMSLLAEAHAGIRNRLLSLYASLSRLAGWLAFNLSNYDAASDYYESARAAAHEAHDTDLAAFVLCNMSHLATWRGQPRAGIDHAVAAQLWANRTDDLPLRAFAADLAARAYAADQQNAACFQHLDLARELLSAHHGDSSLVHFYNLEFLDSIHGMCLVQLNRPQPALEYFSGSADRLDYVYVRNIAFNAIYRSKAQLALRDIDAAAHSLGHAATLAGLNRSARLVEQIHATRAELAPWTDSQAVVRLDDQLRNCALA